MKKLSELAAKPQLTEIILDDADIVEKYGEELQFFIYDKLPIATYTKLASINTKDAGELYNAVKDLILDDKGLPVVNEGLTLPMDIMNAAIMKVTDSLGK